MNKSSLVRHSSGGIVNLEAMPKSAVWRSKSHIPNRQSQITFLTSLFVLLTSAFSAPAFADGPAVQWEKTFGGSDWDYGYSVQQTSDGGYIIAGDAFCEPGSVDVYLVKTDSAGNLLWQKTFGGSDYDWGHSVQQTSDGGYIIAGTTYSFGAGSDDVYLVKTDSAGNLLWQKTFGGSEWDGGNSVQQTSDGGYIIAGRTESFGAGSGDVYLIKTDSEGNQKWQQTFGGSNSDWGYSVQQTSDGGYIIAGVTDYYPDDYVGDVYLVKTDSAGNLLWQKTFGGSVWDCGYSVQQTSDGGYIIAGETYSFGAGNFDVYLIKVAPEDLTLKRFEINQCFQDVNEVDGTTQVYELIETKPFVARITLDRIKPGAASAKVKLDVFNTASGEQIGKTKEKPATIKYGTPETVDILFNDDETKNMKAGDYKFSLIVEDTGGNKLLEQNLTYQFKSSKTVRMLAVQHLFYNLQTGVWNDSYVSFTEQVFPVPKTTAVGVNRLEIVPLHCRFKVSGIHWSLLLLQMSMWFSSYNNSHPRTPADFICAVLPDGTLGSCTDGITLGRAIVIEAQNETKFMLGHEIGHIYDLGEEYVQSTTKNANGLWVLYQTFNFGTEKKPGNPPPLKFDATGPFIIGAGRPNTGQRCDWSDDRNSYSAPFFGDLCGTIGWACRGRFVGEGSYDVENNAEVSPSTIAMMGGTGSPRWVSGPEYRTLISRLVPIVKSSQAGHQSLEVKPLSDGEPRVIVSGIININMATAELCLLIPAPNLELTHEVNDPNLSLSFISKGSEVLGSFKFEPLKSEYISVQRPFSVIVDLPVGTAVIKVVISGTAAAELKLTDNSPIVSVLSPNGSEQITDQLHITWSASDPDANDANDLAYTIEFSHNNGVEWGTLAIDYEVNELTVDANYLPGGQTCLVKVIASDGWNRSEDISDAPFSITTKPPKVTILDPEDGTILLDSESMQGRCLAYDPETGDITDPNAIVWTSNVDGFLGKGNLTGFDLSLGHHTLTATATDPEGKTGTDTVTVTVVANFADFNSDRRVDFFDLSKFAENWQANCSEPNWCEGTDLDRSGVVDFADLLELCSNWLWQAQP